MVNVTEDNFQAEVVEVIDFARALVIDCLLCESKHLHPTGCALCSLLVDPGGAEAGTRFQRRRQMCGAHGHAASCPR